MIMSVLVESEGSPATEVVTKIRYNICCPNCGSMNTEIHKFPEYDHIRIGFECKDCNEELL